MRHTPGPWRVNRRAVGNVEDLNGRSIASCMGYSTNTDNGEHHLENLANAHLIARCPQLLEALEELAEMAHNVIDVPDSIWQLISKAKGA